MALTEALRLVIDADTRGAVKGLEKVGSTAEKELKKGAKGIDRFASGLTKAGVGMVTTGALIVGGLVKAAQASEDARLGMLKLENSVQNNGRLAGHSAEEFAELADAIQDKTAADADAIVEGEAMLATFNVTADQLRTLTPLVVDYSRKFGVDLVAANSAVGKALDGSIGALKRNGVTIDETKFKTDRYGAVLDALEGQVGGFAEAEGKTFAGSLERMKNQLGDVAEGVGVGAVDAFSSMIEVVDPLIDKFNNLDPAVQSTVGKFAAFGATGLIFAGTASTIIGQAIKMRQNFNSVGIGLKNAEGGLTKFGKVAGGLGLAATAVELAYMGSQMDGLTVSVENLNGAFADMNAVQEEQTRRQLELAEAAGGLDKLIGDVADQSVPAAERLLQFAEANGLSAEQVNELRKVIQEKQAADVQGTQDQAAYNAEVSEAAGVAGDAAEETKSYAEQIRDVSNALKAQFDPLFAAQDALNKQRDAQQAVTDALKANKDGIKDNNVSQEELIRLNQDAVDAALNYESSLINLKAAVENEDVSIDDAADTLQRWTREGLITKTQADQALYSFTALGGKADELAKKNPKLRIVADAQPAFTELDRLARRLNELPGNLRYSVGGGGGLTLSSGGLVPQYLASGGLGGPRGTDTVPAWLTPGEFVMSKSSVDRLGVGAMRAMNEGAVVSSGGGGTEVFQVILDGRVVAEAVRRHDRALR